MVDRKSAFTLVEGLISLVLISAVGMMGIKIASAYLKNCYERDKHTMSVISAVDIMEKAKYEIHTLSDLYNFSNEYDVLVYEIGAGKVEFQTEETYNIVLDDEFSFDSCFDFSKHRLFRIKTNSEDSSLNQIVRIEVW